MAANVTTILRRTHVAFMLAEINWSYYNSKMRIALSRRCGNPPGMAYLRNCVLSKLLILCATSTIFIVWLSVLGMMQAICPDLLFLLWKLLIFSDVYFLIICKGYFCCDTVSNHSKVFVLFSALP